MAKRAVRYIRTAPNSVYHERILSYQDTQTNAYCKAHEYEIVATYTDLDKYASDERPEFERMLMDARAGKFDTIVAIHEDRLYRGVSKDMLDVADLVRSGVVTIELVEISFD
jgi:DNA invertase Pin-like site-specific DNA recombinase